MPALGAEVPAVQLPMLRYAGQIGWSLVSQADALKRRGGETGRLFTQTLTHRIIQLNRDNGLNGVHAAEVLRRLQSLPARIEGKHQPRRPRRSLDKCTLQGGRSGLGK